MRLRIQNGRSRAFGLLEVLVVVTCLVVLVAMLLPILAASKRPSQRINCASNLKQVNLAFRIWEGDNNNKYPMLVSVTNGGGMELIEAGYPVACFQVASNEMGTTKLLVCPEDSARTFATNFDELNGSHISYFLSADANEDYPKMILDGDDNLQINGSPVKSGLVDVSSNTSVEWVPGRHSDVYRPHFWSFPKRFYWGNFGFADGSVQQGSSAQLRQAFQRTGLATNRIVIP